jgi:hypothetical protein
LQLIKGLLIKFRYNILLLKQSEIEKQIPELAAYKEKDLLYIDPAKPLAVRRSPYIMAGVAVFPYQIGPYDKNANTYYNVGSLNGWTESRKFS